MFFLVENWFLQTSAKNFFFWLGICFFECCSLCYFLQATCKSKVLGPDSSLQDTYLRVLNPSNTILAPDSFKGPESSECQGSWVLLTRHLRPIFHRVLGHEFSQKDPGIQVLIGSLVLGSLHRVLDPHNVLNYGCSHGLIISFSGVRSTLYLVLLCFKWNLGK